MAADSGMDTCPSPEIADSRKRPLARDNENGDVKRSHFSSVQDLVTALPMANGHGNASTSFGGEGTYHFKLLVPSVAAGAIIGKGGETIAQLQKDTTARVKMSKTHDYYPGTSERVCLITGSVDAIMAVLDFIIDKIKEKPDLTKAFTEIDAKMTQERDKQVKILVPNSTAGMIIGKAGNYIKQISATSGSYVQISQKATDVLLQERCITVIGDKESNKKACMMILSKVVDDPHSGTCPNVSYADIAGPVANFNPTGSPYAHSQQSVSGAPVVVNGAGSAAAAALSALNLTLNLAPNSATAAAASSPITQPVLDHIKKYEMGLDPQTIDLYNRLHYYQTAGSLENVVALRNAGYSEPGCTEIGAALSLLAKHGVLGLGLQPLPTSAIAAAAATSQAMPTAAAALPAAAYFPLADQAAAVFGPIAGVGLGSGSPSARNSLERFAADMAFDAAFRPQAIAPVTQMNNTNAYGLGAAAAATNSAAAGGVAGLMPISKSPTPADLSAKDTKNVEIAEVIVGAILGPGGSKLIEIQQQSGANIQISKKGTFAPGTRNRIVTITGSPTAINSAQYLIELRINEEEVKRARHNALSGHMQ